MTLVENIARGFLDELGKWVMISIVLMVLCPIAIYVAYQISYSRGEVSYAQEHTSAMLFARCAANKPAGDSVEHIKKCGELAKTLKETRKQLKDLSTKVEPVKHLEEEEL